MKQTITLIAIVVLISSCATIDVQKKKIREIQERNKQYGDSTPAVYVTPEEVEERKRERVEADLNVITVTEEIFIPVDSETKRPLSRDEVVQRSMQDAIVTPQNFIGGTQFYDFNEHRQYPVVCKVLGLTVIQLENNEIPIGVPYLSDTLRWEITGDLWRTTDGLNVQLVMIKPLEEGLTTNMVLITNRRIYQFLLTSTRNSYMPMVRFRYPLSPGRFITAETIRQEKLVEEQSNEGYYLSYNYKIVSGWALSGWFKPDWTPIEIWDDGHKTYIRLPRGVLQQEYPTVFEGKNYIINYRVSENVMILDKLIRTATLRLNGKRVKITKQKGEAEDLRRYVRREAEVIGDRPPVGNQVRFDISGAVPWLPEKVIEYDGETYVFFGEGIFDPENVLYIIDENRDQLEYRKMGNVIIIPKIIRKIQLAYNNQMLTITRR